MSCCWLWYQRRICIPRCCSIRSKRRKSSKTYMEYVTSCLYLFNFFSNGQTSITFRIKTTNSWEQLFTVFLGQLGAKRVDSNIDRTTISFKLYKKRLIIPPKIDDYIFLLLGGFHPSLQL